MTDIHGNRNGQPQSLGDAPAFPVSIPGCGDNGWHGMSLRDWFAGQALAMTVSTYVNLPDSAKLLARRCYAVADAMIEERARPADDQRPEAKP